MQIILASYALKPTMFTLLAIVEFQRQLSVGNTFAYIGLIPNPIPVERVTLDSPQMILDVIDEVNQVLGQQTLDHIHQTGAWHRGLHVLVFDSQDRLLLNTRSEHGRSNPAYDCPITTHVRTGETYPVAAARAIQEQLGIQGVVVKWLLEFKMQYSPTDNMITDLFECVYDRPISPQIIQAYNLQWYTLDQIETMLIHEETHFTPWTREILIWVVEKPSQLNIILAR